MIPAVETQRFHWSDPAAKTFYDDHGYVIVTGVLDSEERATIRPAWQALVEEAAEAAELDPISFEQRFPQNRDLWSKSEPFRSLLFETRQGEVARHFLGTQGARLFHDHAIAKPSNRSDTIPWHQDSSYWPVDRAGNSLWTPVEGVATDGGCLKVLDGSHLDGPGTPQDFLNPDDVDRDADPRLTLLPVEAGETVVLHGLTWHGSGPNTHPVDRLAYLTLWVPSSSCFQPAHAGWHPTAAHIEVAPGERLRGDWFPLFGAEADNDGEAVAFSPLQPGEGLTMFDASKAIRGQLCWLLGVEDLDLEELDSHSARASVVEAAQRRGVLGESEVAELRATLTALVLQERIRKRYVARDVYLSTVQRWWHLVGHRIQDQRLG